MLKYDSWNSDLMPHWAVSLLMIQLSDVLHHSHDGRSYSYTITMLWQLCNLALLQDHKPKARVPAIPCHSLSISKRWPSSLLNTLDCDFWGLSVLDPNNPLEGTFALPWEGSEATSTLTPCNPSLGEDLHREESIFSWPVACCACQLHNMQSDHLLY